MSRAFTYYWNDDEFVRNEAAIAAGERPNAEYTGGSGFIARGVNPGDQLYLLNWSKGELWVLGRMVVGEVLDRQAATARRADIYDAPEHLLAAPGSGSPIVVDAILHTDDVDELRFVAPDGALVAPKRSSSGKIEPQTFRGLREIDDATAELLDDTLGFTPGQHFDGSMFARRVGVSVVLVDDDANEQETFVELETTSTHLLARNIDIDHSVDDPAVLLDEERWTELVDELVRRWADGADVSIDVGELDAQLHGSDAAIVTRSLDEPAPALLGTAPLEYPPAGSLPGKKGSRTDAELTAVPDAGALSEVGVAAQAELLALVGSVGGRLGLAPTPAIPVGDLDVLVALLEEWVNQYGDHLSDGIAFSRPGLWHALDRLVPLQNPNRWDRLRKALTSELQARGWVRAGGPRGSKWWVPNRVV